MARVESNSCDYLYGNVRVGSVIRDVASGALTIKVVCAEREEQKMHYENVLYSQLDDAVEGNLVAIAMELTPDEYRDAKHKVSAKLFREDCSLNSLDPLDEMIRQGYRIFTHYVGEHDELIIIAKRLIID